MSDRAQRQLELFSTLPSEGTRHADPARPSFDEERALARRLPSHVRFGTSSWSFPGWHGLVYAEAANEKRLAERGLREYAEHPLFSTVGIDSSYYRPLSPALVSRYNSQLPQGFRCVMKAYGELTSWVRRDSGELNPHFLDSELFEREVLPPLEAFQAHLGPIVFELPPIPSRLRPKPPEFLERLERFLVRLPRGFQYAVEIRNRELFTHRYLESLESHGVAHVLNFWERMPDLGEQLAVDGVLTADFVVTRLLIPPGQRYLARKQALAPFDKIVRVEHKMRDDVAELVTRTAAFGKVLFVIVNNKAEGSSPLTIRALAERVARPK